MSLDLSKTAAIIGAGFSKEAKLPLTGELSSRFLEVNESEIDKLITKFLREYWERVFGYKTGGLFPSFEDHFTVLDLAANVGHNLGHHYTPARLRAIRRLSIHRVFQILDSAYEASPNIGRFLQELTKLTNTNSAIVSLNWDTVVEKHLSKLRRYAYCIDGVLQGGPPDNKSSDPHFHLIKLHGSANWHYCDSCHSITVGRGNRKTTLEYGTFLELDDFQRLADGDLPPTLKKNLKSVGIKCEKCENAKTTARVATFSHAKAFDFFPFHASWHAALQNLGSARKWIFIGYSFPDADFAFRHLLKTAQLAAGITKEIMIVLKDDDEAEDRFRRFFGGNIVVCQNGLGAWVNEFLT